MTDSFQKMHHYDPEPQDVTDGEFGWPVFWPEDAPATDAATEAAPEVESVETGAMNWAAFNARQQKKVRDWVADPAMVGTVVRMLHCVLPTCKFMTMSKVQQPEIATKGDEASESTDEDYLILLREEVSTYMTAIKRNLHQLPNLLHMQPAHIPDLQLLAFKLLARGGACVQKLLVDQHLDMTPFSMMQAAARGHHLKTNTQEQCRLETRTKTKKTWTEAYHNNGHAVEHESLQSQSKQNPQDQVYKNQGPN